MLNIELAHRTGQCEITESITCNPHQPPCCSQVARLQREERLGALNIELANRKVLRLSEIRGFSRAVRSVSIW